MKPKIKPCPFCGGKNLKHGGNYVDCLTCGGQMYAEQDDDQGTGALRKWNRRVLVTEPPKRGKRGTWFQQQAAKAKKGAVGFPKWIKPERRKHHDQ